MKVRTTFRLFVTVCILGAVIAFLEWRTESTDARKVRLARVLPISADSVSFLAITAGELDLALRRSNAGWLLERPLVARADEGCVNQMLSLLERLDSEETVTAAQRNSRSLTLADYGLESPRIRIVVRDALGSHELMVGSDAPLGPHLYTRLKGSDNVIATSRDLLGTVPPGVEAIRDRSLLHGDAARTSRVEVQRPAGGFMQLIRNGDRWVLQQPIVARADMARTEALLDAMFSLKVSRFVWDPPLSMQDNQPGVSVEPYGLADDEAVARIKVFGYGDDVGSELVLGRNLPDDETLTYARLTGSDSIYAVKRTFLSVVPDTASDLRDRDLFAVQLDSISTLGFYQGDARLELCREDTGIWRINEPVKWAADNSVVHGVLRRLTALRVVRFGEEAKPDLKTLGLAPPAVTVELGVPAEAGISEPLRLQLAALREGESTVFARFESHDFSFELEAAAVAEFYLSPVDPLVYRDRTVLAIDPDRVQRIMLTTGEGERVIALNGGSTWRVPDVPDAKVDLEAVTDILFYAANLRAARTESHNPRSLKPYGLDKPVSRLTLGLRGDEGIQKSILFGNSTDADDVYAMVQGQDVVFVLPRYTVNRITRAFIFADEGKREKE